jgi:hypothetical protein
VAGDRADWLAFRGAHQSSLTSFFLGIAPELCDSSLPKGAPPMNLHVLVPQFAKMLHNLDGWLGKAVAYAKTKSFEPDVLCQARLAPDQYELTRQVQAACDTAKFTVAYLSGKEPPVHPDTEKTIAELRQRIKTCVSYLESSKESDFAEAEGRKVAPRWLEGKWVRGDQYTVQMAIPNFYFHMTTAYAILRHNGVDLGKMDYIGSLPTRD